MKAIPRFYYDDGERFERIGYDNQPPDGKWLMWLAIGILALLIAANIVGCTVTKPVNPTPTVYKFVKIATYNSDGTINYSPVTIIK